ncbi:serine O-acetyltransferase [Pseudanabaena mucicola]|uniref:Serine acetyltransferase n=1 Tax=Pseudanabaena mucicola FACHB-723 TaxID=2692860 RepID=A0ABR8A0X6_9CYAN|nr:serine acetyltransferase [Pseudanabaena mucicola]MBD2189663.1 serine acetyltransferase [Pseudanabaena mucicola FACHB-723]
MNPSFLWWLSCQAYKHRIPILPKILKTFNFFFFHAVLPYQAEIEKDIELQHYGLGIVIHPNVKIGHRVKIYHGVTLAAETWIGSPYKIYIGDDVLVGAGAAVIGRGNQDLRIGDRAVIGANAVVTNDIDDGETVVGVPAKSICRKSKKT